LTFQSVYINVMHLLCDLVVLSTLTSIAMAAPGRSHWNHGDCHIWIEDICCDRDLNPGGDCPWDEIHGKNIIQTINFNRGAGLPGCDPTTQSGYIGRGNNVVGACQGCSTTGEADCKRRCDDHPDCAAWTLKTATNQCWLKVEGFTTNNGANHWVWGQSCKAVLPRQTIIDTGYPDCGEGWYDVQGQGVSNDYCRWVGHCGCRNNRASWDDPLLTDCSWWSCALAGGTSQYSEEGIYQEPVTGRP